MSENANPYSIKYPRRILPRGIARAVGRLLTPILFHLDIKGKENFPKSGPLLVVGNHSAVMETVMLAVHTPWQVEMLGSIDIPHEKITDIIGRFFGYIPIFRGRPERTSMRQALDVLRQGGILGIFPEGGIWDAGAMQAQSGVAWLSYRSQSPVLPLGFSGTQGALGAALKLKRPKIVMRIGKLIPPARLSEGKPRKTYFQEYANMVMEAVHSLITPEEATSRIEIIHERFELQVALYDRNGAAQNYPPELDIVHTQALAKLLHRPGILKIFRKNLRMPIGALQNLDTDHNARSIAQGSELILNYLNNDNPYLLSYRFGSTEAQAMQKGLEELLALARWAAEAECSLHLTPIRRYQRSDQAEESVQIKQGSFENWM
ncbi:MAG: 1-acyl-sn-glycerol-3-phosphate acyltransferase [Anaerolineales bacterium]|nr:1-acyl-sn-glycerol-3-phosphate acyltransferase [Anaerolineales bacterium]